MDTRTSGGPDESFDLKSAISPARQLAFRVLLRVHRNDQWLDRAFESEVARAVNLSPRDRAASKRIAWGVTRSLLLIDHLITLSTRNKRQINQLDDEVLVALRIGVWELVNNDSAKHHAAVDQAVRIARKSIGHRAVGFVNGVLRGV